MREKIERKFGRTTAELVKTGIMPLDMVLGGGFERGDMIEISSLSGIGKSTVMLHMAKNLINAGEEVVYVDVERGVKNSILKNMGLLEKVDQGFYIYIPVTFEDIEEIFDEILFSEGGESNKTTMIIDSITSVIPSKLRGKSIVEIEPGLESRLTASFLKKYKPYLREKKITLFLVNQMRIKLDFRSRVPADPESAGGYALQFYPDIRIRLVAGAEMKRKELTPYGEKEAVYGMEARIFSLKNRNARCKVPVEIPIIHGKGVSNIWWMKNLMVSQGLISGGAGGYFKVSISGKEETIRGEQELMKHLGTLRKEITELLESKGLMDLIIER